MLMVKKCFLINYLSRYLITKTLRYIQTEFSFTGKLKSEILVYTSKHIHVNHINFNS